ncbi:HlyD family type I secretion periplasmic adaptor subunit [Pseudorhodoplanes sinuspersici]|nr:HlyD family type I secretion periplasmic adaptor subunit [Pseudorhodoplanes sinuspersici]RKE72979.1 epimerase transport system membrane fusion protein [Pseudorhodoplanes sinuspersici]
MTSASSKTPGNDDWSATVKTSLRGPAVAALTIIGIGLGGFLVWASTAELTGAVMASGSIAANGENQTIQHLEGGIVKDIFVKDGDAVVAGQPLIALDPTLVEANLNRARKTLVTLRADEARLLAELGDHETIEFSADLMSAALDPAINDFIQSKKSEFELRSLRYRNEVSILRQRLAGLHEEMAGTEAQRVANKKQMGLMRDELKDLDYLYQKGLARQDRMFAMQRSEADLEGKDGALQAAIGKAKQTIAEIQQQIEKLGHDRRTEAGAKLSETRTRIADTLEQIIAYKSVLSRIIVRAPTDGTVVRLNVNTVGAVISPGQALMELLPKNADLVVEAKLQVTDIDAVHVGQEANIRLAALNQRTTPVVPSHVLFVSADKLIDKQNPNQPPYYRVRLALNLEQLSPRERSLLAPGMPAEAFIATSERTMMRYLFRPIEDSFARALREE